MLDIYGELKPDTTFSLDSIRNLTIAIELRGNSTAGFNWFLTGNLSIPSNAGFKALNLDSNNSCTSYYPDSMPQGFTGGEGTYCFNSMLKIILRHYFFNTIDPGKNKIQLTERILH